tara:strand:+ start:270 stop:530 length:261 start_codon:yes stop_codon:yes gene_type:complete
MPHPPSTPRYKVNDKVKVINKTSSFTLNGARQRSKFTRDNNELGTIKEVIVGKDRKNRKQYYYLVKVNRPTPIIRKHQSKLRPFND